MLLLLVVVVGTLAPIFLLLAGRSTAAVAVLVALIWSRASDLALSAGGVGPVDPRGLSVLSQATLVAFASLVFIERTWHRTARTLAFHRPAWCAMALYLSVLAASSVWAIDEPAAVGEATSLVKNLLIVYVIAEVLAGSAAQRAVVWALLGAGAALAALTVAQAATGAYGDTFLGFAQAPVREIVVGAADNVRASGPIGDPNFYALILAVLVPLGVLRARDEPRARARVAAVAIVVLLVVAIALTYSRAGLLTVGVGLVAAVALARLRPRDIAIGLACLVAAAPVVPSAYWTRIASLARGDASIANREASQQVALALFTAHPLLGVGADNYPVRYFDEALRLDVPNAADHPHNLYLAVAAETGILGVATFLAAVYLPLRALWRRRRAALAAADRVAAGLASSLFAALLTYLVGVAFLPIAYPRYLWLTVGLGLAVAGPHGAPARSPAVAAPAVRHLEATPA